MLNERTIMIVMGIVILLLIMYIVIKPSGGGTTSGFGDFALDGHPDILQLSKLQSVSMKMTTKKEKVWEMTNKPTYFPNGIKIYMDKVLKDISSEDILNEVKKVGEDKIALMGLPETINAMNNGTVDNIENIKHSAEHYIELITNFLAENSSASIAWRDTLDYLGAWVQIKVLGKEGELPNSPAVPDMETVYEWIKYSITKVGGVAGLVKRFQKRIKYDLIQSIVNDDEKYRTVDKDAAVAKGSGKCTIYPLKWWQNCPDGTKPSGSRGWDKDGACNKWYQHWSGELMCSNYEYNYNVPVGGTCSTIIGLLDKLTDDTVRNIISISLSTILSTLGMIPQLAAVIRVIKIVFFLALPLVGDFTWLLNDLKDVCYNFTCVGANFKDKTVCNNPENDKKAKPMHCVPGTNDSVLAGRDCENKDAGCNTKPSGTCMDKTEFDLWKEAKKTKDNTNNMAAHALYAQLSGYTTPSSEILRFSQFI